MRVAYVCADPGVPVFGSKGASVHVQGVVAALLRAGAEVTLFARRCGGDAPAGVATATVRQLDPVRAPEAAVRERLLAAQNHRLAELVAGAGPFDVLYERHALWSWGALEAARDAGVPAVLEVNAPLVDEQASHRGLADRAAAEAGVRRALRAADEILAVSAEVAERLSAHPEATDKVDVVPNAVDPDRFPPRRRSSGGPFTVGFVGTLKPWHGLDTLAAAFAALRAMVPDARLLVVGDGPGRAALSDDLRDRGLIEAATMTGAVPPADVPALLARMDAGVAPYPAGADHYFSPLKVFEYMAAGLPVVASRIGQIPAIVEHERTGLLCPPGDASSLALALAGLADDATRRVALGAAAREKVLRDHTWDTVALRVVRLAGERVGAGA